MLGSGGGKGDGLQVFSGWREAEEGARMDPFGWMKGKAAWDGAMTGKAQPAPPSALSPVRQGPDKHTHHSYRPGPLLRTL